MFSEAELATTRKQNYQYIRELVRISFGLGVNLTSSSKFKDSLRIINVFLVVCSGITMYGHWCYIMGHVDNIPKLTESLSTALQTIISIIKMIYFLFVQRELYELLFQAETYEVIRHIQIFKTDFPVNQTLKKEILCIMTQTWRGIRRQLIFYICCCTAIISNYFIRAILINTYHQYQGTNNFIPELPFPSMYNIWTDKGLAFPYYPIEMFLSTCGDYIAGMGAVSFDGLFIVLCLHCTSLIEVLKLMVSYSTSPLVPKERRVEYLRYCIYYYQRIEKYTTRTHMAFKHISITQFLLSLVIIGLVLFQITYGLEVDLNMAVRMVMYISAAGYEIIIFCYNGQLLNTASEGLPLAFYSCKWYDESEEFKQLLRMMIMRTNRPFYFEISSFSTMSLPTLMAFGKTSGSYFLLLRNVSQ